MSSNIKEFFDLWFSINFFQLSLFIIPNYALDFLIFMVDYPILNYFKSIFLSIPLFLISYVICLQKQIDAMEKIETKISKIPISHNIFNFMIINVFYISCSISILFISNPYLIIIINSFATGILISETLYSYNYKPIKQNSSSEIVQYMNSKDFYISNFFLVNFLSFSIEIIAFFFLNFYFYFLFIFNSILLIFYLTYLEIIRINKEKPSKDYLNPLILWEIIVGNCVKTCGSYLLYRLRNRRKNL